MSAVQALAALLSANADAGSRVAAAQVGANAANANAQAALQGDIYRSNMQGLIANRGIDADMQRFVGEQALRSMLGKQQLGIEAGRLGLGREQLGINRQQLNQERDFRLGEIGRGPYAPNAPASPGAGGDGGGLMGMLQGLLGGGQKQGGGDMQERARQMIMANPGDPRVLQMWGQILNQGAEQQRWQSEMDWKKGSLSDPNVLFANIAPHVAGMEGVNPQNLGGVLGNLMAQLKSGGMGGGTPGAVTPQTMNLTDATGTLASPDTAELMKAFGINDNSTPWQMGEAIGERASSLTPADIAAIQKVIAAKAKANPKLFENQAESHPGVMLLRKLLTSQASSLDPGSLQSEFQRQRADYYKNGGDPKTTMMFGIPKLW